MLPAHLTDTLNNLGDAARSVADEVRADSNQRAQDAAAQRSEQRKHNRRVMGLLLAVAVLVAGLVTISVANRRLGQSNARLNRQNSQIVEQIQSCTTVGGTCYEQQSRRTSKVAEQLLESNVIVAACSRENSAEAAIRACVQERLSEQTDPEPPAVTGPASPAPASAAP